MSIFLTDYYRLIRYAYEQLDRPFIFGHGNCFGCGTAMIRQLEERLVELARQQLSVVITGMLVSGNNGMVVPLGSEDGAMYLTAMTETLLFAANILQASPYRNSYDCVVWEIMEVYRQLTEGYFMGPVDAVETSYQEVQNILRQLSFHSCWRGEFQPGSYPGNAPIDRGKPDEDER
jgi:hypothetical protein